MINVIKSKTFRCCAHCYSSENVKTIVIRYMCTNDGMQLTLCNDCIQDLVNKLLAGEGGEKDARNKT